MTRDDKTQRDYTGVRKGANGVLVLRIPKLHPRQNGEMIVLPAQFDYADRGTIAVKIAGHLNSYDNSHSSLRTNCFSHSFAEFVPDPVLPENDWAIFEDKQFNAYIRVPRSHTTHIGNGQVQCWRAAATGHLWREGDDRFPKVARIIFGGVPAPEVPF